MGYYTKFECDITGPSHALDALEDSGDSVNDWLTIDDLINIENMDRMKWYSVHHDMIALSERFPELLFVLKGEGEESGDMWKGYYRNGKNKTVEAVVTFPSFDVDKELPAGVRSEEEIDRERVNAEWRKVVHAVADAQGLPDDVAEEVLRDTFQKMLDAESETR